MSRSETNRSNAQHSTGPKRPRGKAAASQNATEHGLTARAVLLPEEDAGAFVRLARRLRSALRPVGALEQALAERVVACVWRLRRVLAVEASVFEYRRRDALSGRVTLGAAFSYDAANVDAFGKLARYEAAVERGLYRALHELERLQARRAGERVAPPAVLDVDVNMSVVADATRARGPKHEPATPQPAGAPVASFRRNGDPTSLPLVQVSQISTV